VKDEPLDPSEAPTPKASGTLNRWPVFQELALAISTEADRLALRAEKVIEEISFNRARDLRRVAKAARGLAEAFGAWEHGDPGQELRGGALTRLFELREEAQALGVDTSGVRM
jgi:hypothetical protein